MTHATNHPTPAPIEDQMAAYYVQRAAYYERVYFKPERQTDLRQMEAWVAQQFGGRRVLEIACGTGWWTLHGAQQAAHWRATDLNPETMAVARHKPMPASVQFQTVDAYSLAELGDEKFDAAFTGCWWSHVPLARLADWLATLHARLLPGATVVMLDNSFVQTSSTPLSRSDAEGNTYQQRTLDDGSSHEVLKNFPTPAQAIAALGPRARDVQWIGPGTQPPHAVQADAPFPCEHYWLMRYTLA
jgi:demethylmenaquinone methyltransferase/2-methoxy-6-polyprenyl-1,4-benzoquinol methylase